MSRAESIDHAGWRLTLALPACLEKSQEALLDLVTATAAGHTVEPMRRSRLASTYQTYFADAINAPLRIFVRVVDPPALFRLKQLWRGSPVQHVVAITTRLTQAGFNAPPIWIHGRHPGTRRELIVTPRSDGVGPLMALAKLADETTIRRVTLRGLGVEIARLHRAGFVHGDLTPFNLFLVPGEAPRFVLLDHERTRRAFVLGRARRQRRNLVQLGRFALPGLSRTDRLRVLAAYVETLDSRDPRALKRRINRMIMRRLEKDGGWQSVPKLSPSMLETQHKVQSA